MNIFKILQAVIVVAFIGFSSVAQATDLETANKMIGIYEKAVGKYVDAKALYVRLGWTHKLPKTEYKLAKYQASLDAYIAIKAELTKTTINIVEEKPVVEPVDTTTNKTVEDSNNATITETTNVVSEKTSDAEKESTKNSTDKVVEEKATEKETTTEVIIVEETVVEETVVEEVVVEEVVVVDPKTVEFYSAGNGPSGFGLNIINADEAYKRGFTGKGSTIVIADSGANVNHIDLKNQIIGTKNFIDGGTDVTDNVGHGTHVAGIAAAEKNNNGMHGVAYGSKLLIAKVTDNRSYSDLNAMKAAKWGNENGAVVINVSANTTRFDYSWKNSLVKLGNSSYYSNHYFYGVNGYNGVLQDAYKWKQALGNEMVLVRAAGNTFTDYAAGGNQLATATDANGNLILDGQMIIVGNFTGSGVNGAKAGNVCVTYVDGVCKDAAKVSDFYIVAPGVWNSTGADGGYNVQGGTSMAAPAVSGAVAIIHEMWPHMKGKNIVQLVLKTANKDLPNYNVETYGQGMLDLNAATMPNGFVGIPTTGRTDGNKAALSGVVAGNVSSNKELQSIMVLDGFERDYYIDLSQVVSIDTRASSVASNYGVTNFYAGYGDANKRINFLTYNLNDEGTITWNPGFTQETQTYLGNQQSGVYGNLESSTTTYANFNYADTYGTYKVFGQFGFGITNADFDTNDTMLKSANTMLSTTWSIGAEKNGFGAFVSQPVNIESAEMTFSVPTSRTLDGNVVSEDRTINFNSEREIDFTAYYKYNVDNISFKTFIEQRTGFINDTGVGVNVAYKW